MKTIVLASDHAGFELKEKIKQHLQNYTIKDVGCFSVESVDYPDFAHLAAKEVINNTNTVGILCCGSGNGINITANKYKEIRSALCWKKEIAELARQHNDANVLALPARFISEVEAIDIVNAFLNTPFEGGRHLNRVNKITNC